MIVDTLVDYFKESKGVDFTEVREIEFRKAMRYCIDNYQPTEKYLTWYYHNVCMNPKAWTNEHRMFKDMCREHPILNKKWIQYKKTENLK